MDFSELQIALSTTLPVPVTDPNFVAIMPSVINDAEGRIYKDMDFLATNEVDSTSRSFAIGNREVSVPDLMVIVQKVGFISGGRTTILREIDIDVLDVLWPDRTTTGTVQYWARKDDDVIAVAAAPASADQVEFTGRVRPAPMSDSNQNTYIGDKHPELLMAACMVFLSGYQRNFGAQAEDPKMGLSWESVYQSRLKSSLNEEALRRGMGPRS